LTAFLAALQLADSALPVGRFTHSSGLETLLSEGPLSEDELEELAASLVSESAGPLDGVAVAAAHQAETPDQLRVLDHLVTTRKLAPAARLASQTCGRRLAALALNLTDAEPAASFCAATVRRGTDGNLAVVEGAVARALGIPRQQAVAIEIRSAATSLLSAAVRLGHLPASRAQVILLHLAGPIEAAASAALKTSPHEMHSTLPELEIHMLRHEQLETRLFMS
jgi:urease accessory protein